MKNECELKKFKICAVYPRVKSFKIYTTISFFKIFFPLLVCVKKYLVSLKKEIIIIMAMRRNGSDHGWLEMKR